MKALADKIALDHCNQFSSDAALLMFGIDPDTFEKRNGLGRAAVGVFADTNFGKPGNSVVINQGDVTGALDAALKGSSAAECEIPL